MVPTEISLAPIFKSNATLSIYSSLEKFSEKYTVASKFAGEFLLQLMDDFF
jgi:hypothetical protein